MIGARNRVRSHPGVRRLHRPGGWPRLALEHRADHWYQRAWLDEKINDQPKEKRIGREAADWVVKFDGVQFDARDVRAFRRWLAKSEDHRAAFELASRTWHKLDLLARLEAFDLPVNDDAPMISRRALAAGAGVLAIGIGSYVALSGSNAEAFETGIGERREVELADGTRVLLNAKSRIEVRIGENRREARVTAGEALFSIAESTAGVLLDRNAVRGNRGRKRRRAGEAVAGWRPGRALV